MSTVDMMILGILIKQPMNAYEMKKTLEYRNVKAWTKVSSPAIYKNLLKLNKAGYIDGETVRDGAMPEKTIYTINEKGRTYFMQLMKNCSDNPGMVYVEFASFVANLIAVDKETGCEMLENLHGNIEERLAGIKRQMELKGDSSEFALSIIDLHIKMYEVFDKWIEDFKPIYENHKE
jgi:DNA-binding PadR family transcriptional regulator